MIGEYRLLCLMWTEQGYKLHTSSAEVVKCQPACWASITLWYVVADTDCTVLHGLSRAMRNLAVAIDKGVELSPSFVCVIALL